MKPRNLPKYKLTYRKFAAILFVCTFLFGIVVISLIETL